jgi:hypothetical protein
MLKRELFKILKEIGLVDNEVNQFAVYKVEGIEQYKISDNKCNEYKGDFKRLTELLEDEILMSLLNIEVRIDESDICNVKGIIYKYKTWRVSFHTKNLGYKF